MCAQGMAPSQMAAHLQQLLGGPLQRGMGMNIPLVHLLLLRCMAHVPLLTGGLSPTAMSGMGLSGPPGAMPGPGLGGRAPPMGMYPMLGGLPPSAPLGAASAPRPTPGQVRHCRT